MLEKLPSPSSFVEGSDDAARLIEPVEAICDWRFYEHHIERCRRHFGGLSSDDVLTCIQFRTMQLWRTRCRQGMGVTELQTYPQYKQLLIFMVAGHNARDWLQGAHQTLQAFAHANDCKYMEFHGRPGWEHICERLGYDHKMIKMRKAL